MVTNPLVRKYVCNGLYNLNRVKQRVSLTVQPTDTDRLFLHACPLTRSAGQICISPGPFNKKIAPYNLTVL